MKVLERALTPDGVEIQLEDWREDNTKEYPNLHGYTIAAYPVAKNSSKWQWIKSGDRFRLSIATNNYNNYTEEMVLSDYEALKNGNKRIEDLAEHFWNGQKDMYYLGMNVENLGY